LALFYHGARLHQAVYCNLPFPGCTILKTDWPQWITGILQIVFSIGTAIYYFYRHYYSAAVVFVIFGIFSIICFVSWIPRIPFSVVMLQTTMDVAKGFGHVFLVSAIGGLAALAFGAWFSVTLVSIYVTYEPNGSGRNPACARGGSASSCSSAKVIGLIVFITFAGYWITEWIKNTMHSTVAGVYGMFKSPIRARDDLMLMISRLLVLLRGQAWRNAQRCHERRFPPCDDLFIRQYKFRIFGSRTNKYASPSCQYCSAARSSSRQFCWADGFLLSWMFDWPS